LINNVYITGFMGAGKTSLGVALAAGLRRRFVDMDEAVSNRLGMSIPQAFDQLGEQAFRDAESAELKRLSRQKSLVVATGGGAVERQENRRMMRASGIILHLSASLETCRAHLDPAQTAGRPLWQDEKMVANRYEKRQPFYADCDLSVSADGKNLLDVSAEAMAWLLADESYVALLDGKKCPVIVTSRAPKLLKELVGNRKLALLSDRNLERLHLDRYRRALSSVAEVIVAPGENSKSLKSAEKVYQALLEDRLERNDLLVAVGGGVVTDLGAFVAATYKRGIDFVLCSTSLVGCVDAAIGGKAAVNLAGAKNQVGCFTRPLAVLLDLLSLATLPRRAIVEGLVEAYKTGLVADPSLSQLMEDYLVQLVRGDVLCLAQVVKMAAKAKADVVSEDFRESGKRRILNLGHTYGHALESHNRYKVGHGRAVAAGMRVAVELSRARGLLADSDADRMQKVLVKLAKGKMVWPSAGEAWPIMLNDKKNVGGKVIFVLLSGPGKPEVINDLEQAELQAALSRLINQGSY
jgi:shikimate kinase/3-dehydroquinate synthase